MNNKNIFTEDVTIISVVPLDFTSSNGDKICGYTVHYFRDLSQSEKGKVIGKKYEKIYLSKERLDDKVKYETKIYPIKAKIDFAFESLSQKPKPIDIKF